MSAEIFNSINLFKVFFILYAVALTIEAIIKYRKTPELPWPHKEKRPEKDTSLSFISFYVFMVSLIVLGLMLGQLTYKEIGCRFVYPPLVSFLAGLSAALFWHLLHHKLIGRYKIFRSTKLNYRTFRMLLPRNKRNRMYLVLTIVLFNPILEEVVFRGLFVHYLGTLIHNMPLMIVLGWVQFLIIHLYQGKMVVYQHTLHYFIFVGLMFSPFGLIGSIGFHFGGDLFPCLAVKTVIKEYREEYRRFRTGRT